MTQLDSDGAHQTSRLEGPFAPPANTVPPPGLRGSLSRGAAELTIASVLVTLTFQVLLVASGVLAARTLGVQNCGELALVLLFPPVLAQFASLGLPLAATYTIASGTSDPGPVLRSLRWPILLQSAGLIAIQVSLIAVLFSSHPEDVRLAALLTLAVGPSLLLQMYGLAVLQGQARYVPFNLLRLLPAVLYTLSVALAFAVGWHDVLPIVVLWVASASVSGVTTMAFARPVGGAAGDHGRTPLIPMLTFGLRGLLGYASPVERFRIDQAVTGLLLSAAALGLYVVAVSFTNLPRFAAQSVGLIAFPAVARERRIGHSEAVRELWRFFLVGAALSGAIAVTLWALAGWLVPFFFGAEFADAVSVTRILLIGSLAMSYRRLLVDGARGLGRSGLGSLAEVVGWIALVPSLVVLVPANGILGVASAVAISGIVSLGAIALPVVIESRG